MVDLWGMNIIMNVYAKLCCTLLRIKKALGIRDFYRTDNNNKNN